MVLYIVLYIALRHRVLLHIVILYCILHCFILYSVRGGAELRWALSYFYIQTSLTGILKLGRRYNLDKTCTSPPIPQYLSKIVSKT